MNTILVGVGALAFIGYLIWLIVRSINWDSKIPPIIGMLLSVVMILGGLNTSGSDMPDLNKGLLKSSEDVSSGSPSVSVSGGSTDGADSGHGGSFTDLGLGGIGEKNGVYIGLQYAKSMSYLPTALGEEGVPGDSEVLLAFFEFYNGTDSTKDARPEEITCYVDGEQAGDVETYIKVVVDGVRQHHNVNLDAGCQLLTVEDFEVKKGWSEVKFFYGSDCVWTITPADVSANDYNRTSMFDVNASRQITRQGEAIYSEDYEVRFDGVEVYRHENIVWSDTDYLIFKYRVTNNGVATLDTSLMGHKMRAYQDNFYLGDANFTQSEKIGGYINIFDIDSIEPGMSANIYVAFEAIKSSGTAYMVYDDGYITSHYCGTAYAEIG